MKTLALLLFVTACATPALTQLDETTTITRSEAARMQRSMQAAAEFMTRLQLENAMLEQTIESMQLAGMCI